MNSLSTPANVYEIEWWYQGEGHQKSLQHCSGATFGIGLDPGPSCPHHIKEHFIRIWLAVKIDRMEIYFSVDCRLPFSMNAAIQKHLADNPFPAYPGDNLSRWSELKNRVRTLGIQRYRAGLWKDGPQGTLSLDKRGTISPFVCGNMRLTARGMAVLNRIFEHRNLERFFDAFGARCGFLWAEIQPILCRVACLCRI